VRVTVGHSTIEGGEPPIVFRPWDDMESQNPSGSGRTVAMSAHDLANFGHLFISGGKSANGTRVLSEEAVQAMMTPTTPVLIGAPQWGMGDTWGLGPTRSTWGETVVWGHAGSARGGSSLVVWFPEKDTVLSFTINSPTAIEPFTVRMTTDFAEPLVGARAPEQIKAPGEPLGVEHPERYLGTYIRAGARIEVAQDNGQLRYREFNEALSERYKEMEMDPNAGGDADAPLVDEELVVLGEDKFLVGFPGFANGISVFFFGADAQGRATNLNMGFRTARREG